jgi:hypothetical protein
LLIARLYIRFCNAATSHPAMSGGVALRLSCVT